MVKNLCAHWYIIISTGIYYQPRLFRDCLNTTFTHVLTISNLLLTFCRYSSSSLSSLGWLIDVSTRHLMALRLAQMCSQVSARNHSQADTGEPLQNDVSTIPSTMPRAVTAVSCPCESKRRILIMSLMIRWHQAVAFLLLRLEISY